MVCCVYTNVGAFLTSGHWAGPDTVDTMERKTVMVRAYTSAQDVDVEQLPNWRASVHAHCQQYPA